MKSFNVIALILVCLLFVTCNGKKKTEVAYNDLTIKYTVLSVLPHDPSAFTQGLAIHNNKIIESTGQSNSWIAEVNPASGAQDKKVVLDNRYFGEGVTILNNKIYQLTWQSKVGFIYDAHTYKKIGEFAYTTEGWGITHDGNNLIMSDGSEKLYVLDTTTLKPIRTITVMDGNIRVKRLNELEYINGAIFANVWESAVIVKIDPATGNVVGKLDLSPIAGEIKQLYPSADVLNGIAYDTKSKAILVTGKLWPKTYLIKLQ